MFVYTLLCVVWCALIDVLLYMLFDRLYTKRALAMCR
jgi:hypothetical protein